MHHLHLRVFLAMLSATHAIAQPTDSSSRDFSHAEVELIRICEQWQSALHEHASRLEAMDDDTGRRQDESKGDPHMPHIKKLIDFERSNHGTHAGLMAVRHLVMRAASGGEPGNSREFGRRIALAVLQEYANAPELPAVLEPLKYGTTEPQIEKLLRQLIEAEEISEKNRAYAKFTLAEWALWECGRRTKLEQRLRELAEGASEQFSEERNIHSQKLAHALPAERLHGLETEAFELLASLTKLTPNLRKPAVSGLDKRSFIVCFDPTKTMEMPRIADLAAGLLFKEKHLKTGRPAPALELQLVCGDAWSLAEQHDKVVVITFGYKGCGPCEAMYPDLRAMAEDYSGKLSVLTIAVDEKLQDATDSVEAGKVTWNVSWDGANGPVATQWGVDSFPTIYVVGPDGTIAATDVRGDPLRAKISELVR